MKRFVCSECGKKYFSATGLLFLCDVQCEECGGDLGAMEDAETIPGMEVSTQMAEVVEIYAE